jgi:hypothetical protein
MKRNHVAGLVLALCLGFVSLCATTDVAFADSDDEVAEGAETAKKAEGPSTLKTVGAYALGFVGVGMLLVAVTKTFGGLSYPAARLSLVNLLRSNPNQAELVALNMKESFGEAIGTAMRTAAMAGSTDPKVIASATAPTYDATGQAIVARWKGVLGKGKLGVMAAGGGFVIGLTNGGFPVVPFLLALVAVGCYARIYLYMMEVESTLVRARAEVLPEVERALASGRYVFPPRPQ